MCSPDTYLITSVVTAFSMLLFAVVTRMVGVARGRYKIQVPATSGHPDFERYYRVQQNTLEQLMLFLPSLWLCAVYLSPEVASLLGFVWLIGRVLYAYGYYIAAKKRVAGFVIGLIASALLLVGGLVGISQQLFS